MKTRKTTKTAKPALDWRRHHKPDGSWDIDSMTHEELDQLAAEAEKIQPGESRPLTAKERAKFEAWQKKALAEEPKTQSLTLTLPNKLVGQIGELARSRHTTPANLLKRLVRDAIHQAVA